MMRRSVCLLQQAVWDRDVESMPLASGYLKACVEADDRLAGELDVTILNFSGGDAVPDMVAAMQRLGRIPDVLACSVLGWNYWQFGALAETFRQLNPNGWVVWGGTHVAYQAERAFRLFPHVDVVVNGEGELTFPELLTAYLEGRDRTELGAIAGISYRDGDGRTVTTVDRPRITDLDAIPSPILTGALPLTNADGRFRYDVAIMETNRGCPYRCAFCYWGGAIGQKVRTFSRERLREEVERLAKLEVETIVLCDANFGMLPVDTEFIDCVSDAKARYGYPRAIETSWAKNKSEVFYSIVRQMKAAGLTSSFTLALQTLDEGALAQMHRRNMRLNDWVELVEWLRAEGLDCYAELIWGAPGDTKESFLAGYDRLARRVPRIATYPLLLLPNTEYTRERERFGFVTVRGQGDDFEYVLAHNTMSFEDNCEMQRFLIWARATAEHLVFREIWRALDHFAGLRQSAVILSLADWFERSACPVAGVGESRLGDPKLLERLVRWLHSDPAVTGELERWWLERVRPQVPAERQDLLDEVFRYDLLTRPVFDGPEADLSAFERVDGCYVHSHTFSFNVPAIVEAIRTGGEPDLRRSTFELRIRSRAGYHRHFQDHEEASYFVGVADVEEPTAALVT